MIIGIAPPVTCSGNFAALRLYKNSSSFIFLTSGPFVALFGVEVPVLCTRAHSLTGADGMVRALLRYRHPPLLMCFRGGHRWNLGRCVGDTFLSF